MLELLAFILGIVAGCVTGLLPGIHINLVSSLLVSSVLFLPFSPFALVIFIASMAITHTMLDFVPSVYLGAPEDTTFLSVLPGHEMLKEGQGHSAVMLACTGSLCALLIFILFAPFLWYLAPLIEETSQALIPFILIALSLYLVLREEKIIPGLLVFLLAGILGFITLNIAVKEPLLPLLSGLFGASALVLSLKENTRIPPQRQQKKLLHFPEKKEIRSSLFSLFIIGPLCSILPAIGSGYGSIISAEAINPSRKGFLFINGMFNMLVMEASLLLIYLTGKARTGAAAAVQALIPSMKLDEMFLLYTSTLIAGAIALFLAYHFSQGAQKIMRRVKYQKLSFCILIFLAIIIVLLSNALGLLVFITASALGIFCIKSGVKRTHMMGCLLIPTILIYL